jgi:hypothetical protein
MDVDKVVDASMDEFGSPLPDYLDVLRPKKEGLSQFVVGSVVEDHLPLGGVGGTQVEFFVRGTEQWLDPAGLYFVVKGEIRGKSSAKTAAAVDSPFKTAGEDDTLSIEQNFLHSLFSSIDVFVNDVNVTSNNMNYQYISFFEHLFNMSSDARNTVAHEFMWASSETDRKRLIHGGKFSGILIPRSALFQQECFLLNFCDLKIVLNRNMNGKFYLSTKTAPNTTDPFHVELTSMVLRTRKCLISDPFNNYVEGVMAKGLNTRYLLKDGRVVTKSYGSVGSELIEENLCHNVLPYNLIIGFVNSSAFSGDYANSPFEFINFDEKIMEVGLYVNGRPCPNPPIKLNFSAKDTVEAFHYLHEAIQSNTDCDQPLLISKSEFDNGMTLFAFNMSPDQRDSIDYRKAFNQNANIRLYVKFSENIATPFVMTYYYFTGVDLLINKARQVTYVSR